MRESAPIRRCYRHECREVVVRKFRTASKKAAKALSLYWYSGRPLHFAACTSPPLSGWPLTQIYEVWLKKVGFGLKKFTKKPLLFAGAKVYEYFFCRSI
jgi:hypothetical protein